VRENGKRDRVELALVPGRTRTNRGQTRGDKWTAGEEVEAIAVDDLGRAVVSLIDDLLLAMPFELAL
jgi:hypothetical protein